MAKPEMLDDILILRNKINDYGICRVPLNSKELPAMNGQGYYTWQFYLRPVLLDAHSLKTICNDFWRRYAKVFETSPFQIAGVETASVPIITALICSSAERGYALNAFTIRKERKAYGRRNVIEGVPNELPVLFVDDLTSSMHSAFWHAIQVLSEHRLSLCEHAYVVVRKQMREVSPCIATSIGTVVVQSPFALDDFSLELAAYQEERMGAPARRR
jgi:orotate phosphoribosyltransferase